MRLGTAHGRSLVTLLLIEGIATLIESINLCLAIFLFVGILGQAIWN
jgi:hypothetical protein